jgi:V8-like Glu-specific endopeptidase
MFTDAYTKIRESTYALIGRSKGKTISNGTAFMIAPGVLATAAHVLYREKGDSSSFQDKISVVRDPEISPGQKMETVKVVAVDAEYDIGLLEMDNPRTKAFVALTTDGLLTGTEVGAAGYALMDASQALTGSALPLLRFQAGHISASYARASASRLVYYETDVPMYKGSSGCPGFLTNGEVFGMHVTELHDGGDEEKPGQRAFSMWVPASAIISLARKNNIEIPSSS